MVGNLNTWRSHWCWCHSLKIDWEPCIRDLKCATSLQLGAPPVCNFNLMHFKWQVFLKFLLLYFFRHYCTVESQWKEYLRVFWPHGRSLSWLWQVWRQDRSSQYYDLGPIREERHLLPGTIARPGDVWWFWNTGYLRRRSMLWMGCLPPSLSSRCASGWKEVITKSWKWTMMLPLCTSPRQAKW